MKKQIMSIVLAVSMIASLFAVFMLPAVAKQGDIIRDVFVTDGTIVVDGKSKITTSEKLQENLERYHNALLKQLKK